MNFLSIIQSPTIRTQYPPVIMSTTINQYPISQERAEYIVKVMQHNPDVHQMGTFSSVEQAIILDHRGDEVGFALLTTAEQQTRAISTILAIEELCHHP